MPNPIAVLCSDLHFSHRAPVARSAVPDWYAAMERQWLQIRAEAEEENIPVVVAGDIFDTYRSPPELVNFVIRLFRGLTIYAIPGQHDLPNHVYVDLHRSSYGTLIEAGSIRNLEQSENLDGLSLWPFPWGFQVESLVHCQSSRDGTVHLAVIHKYVWLNEQTCYPGAPQEASLAVLKKQLVGYDAAVIGDNHKGFHTQVGSCVVLNCGGFMARKSDERNYKPGFGILYSDGTIDRMHFDTSKDRWIDPEDMATLIEQPSDLAQLIEEFEQLGAGSLDFAEVLIRTMEKNATPEPVRLAVVKALQRGQENES